MGHGFFNHLAAGRAQAWVGPGELGHEVNPAVIAAMAEVGIDISTQVEGPWGGEYAPSG